MYLFVVHLRGDSNVKSAVRRGATVVAKETVEASPTTVSGSMTFPSLSDAISRSWRAHGEHQKAGDRMRDRAVVHAPNTAPFEQVIAVMDAVAATKRSGPGGGSSAGSAFQVAFATN